MKWTLLFPFLAASMLCVTCWCRPAPAEFHEDTTWGFKVKVPRGWRKIPLKAQERWVIGKYQSKQGYVDKQSFTHRPEMKIIVFPESAKKQKSKIESRAKRDGDRIKIEFKIRYKNYVEYLDGNYRGGGWHFTKEEPGEFGGIPVTRYEALVDKLAWANKRIVAWVFHLPGADIAIDFQDVLDSRYRKLKGTIFGTLKSFELIERTEAAPGQSNDFSVAEIPTLDRWENMTPTSRMKFRKKRSDALIKAAVANLPEGWKHKKSPHFAVITHVDSRFTKKVTNQAEAIRDWLDKHFYEIGEDYVPRAIIRVCLDSEEEFSYRKGSADAFSFDSREMVVSKRSQVSRDYEMRYMSRAICSQWFSDKNRLLSRYMPQWIEQGIEAYTATGTVRGRKLSFKPSEWERDGMRRAKREGKLHDARSLIKMTWKDYARASRESSGLVGYQFSSLVRHFMSPKCRKDKLTKDALVIYLGHVNDIAKEIEAKRRKKSGAKMAKSAKEERELRKKEREQDEKQARYIVDEAFKRTFGHWTEENWEKFDRNWQKASS